MREKREFTSLRCTNQIRGRLLEHTNTPPHPLLPRFVPPIQGDIRAHTRTRGIRVYYAQPLLPPFARAPAINRSTVNIRRAVYKIFVPQNYFLFCRQTVQAGTRKRFSANYLRFSFFVTPAFEDTLRLLPKAHPYLVGRKFSIPLPTISVTSVRQVDINKLFAANVKKKKRRTAASSE